jgi:hypothetical protein
MVLAVINIAATNIDTTWFISEIPEGPDRCVLVLPDSAAWFVADSNSDVCSNGRLTEFDATHL